jgi:hypothetical protein
MLFPQLEMRMLKGYAGWEVGFAYGLINRPLVLKAHHYFKFNDVLAQPVGARANRTHNLIGEKVYCKRAARVLQMWAGIGDTVLRWFRRPRRNRGIEVVQIEQFTPDLADALDRITTTFSLIATRTVETLNWRFARVKDRGYKIFIARRDGAMCGYIVTRLMPMKTLASLAIVDILFAADDTAAGDALLARAIDEAYAARVDVCACLVNPHGRYCELLRKRGFLKTPESFTLIVHEPPDSPHRLADVPPADWHLTWFDHDFV